MTDREMLETDLCIFVCIYIYVIYIIYYMCINQGIQVPLRCRQNKDIDFLLEPPERMQLSQPTSDSDLQNYSIII